MHSINFWPILVASVVAFGISSLWYSPILFGKAWMELTKTTNDEVKKVLAGGISKLYIIQFITTFVMFVIVAFILSSVLATGGTNGAFLGFLVWLGFIATEVVNSMIWNKKPFKLAVIESFGTLLNLVIGGAIIGAWR